MGSQAGKHEGKVMTVEGLIPAEAMGITLPHEHLLVQGWDHRDPNYLNSAYLELAQYEAVGGKTIVDLTPIGKERDPLFVKKLSQKAEVQLILGTGYYKEAWLSPEIREMGEQQLSQTMISEIEEGIGGTGIQAGIIGEIGISSPINPTERKVLAACAKAYCETGAAIVLHFDLAAKASERRLALDILEAEGADLSRVVVSHLVPRPDNLELVTELAGRGCYVGFDLFGQERWPLANDLIRTDPEVQISSVKGFINNGLLEKILISQNVCHVTHLTVNGGLGYGYILGDVLPRFELYGISEQEIHTILVSNPAALIPFRLL